MRPWEVLSVTWADNTAKVLSLQDKSRALATALVVLLFFKKKVHFFSSCLFFLSPPFCYVCMQGKSMMIACFCLQAA